MQNMKTILVIWFATKSVLSFYTNVVFFFSPRFFFFMWTIFLKSLLNLVQYCFCFLSWFFGCEARGVLVPWPGIKPTPPALEGEVLATGPPGKFPNRVLVPPVSQHFGDAGHHWTLFRLLCFLLSLLLLFMDIMYRKWKWSRSVMSDSLRPRGL